MTIVEHLAELRTRVIISVVAIAVGTVVAFAFYEPILDVLSGPYCEIRPPDECAFLQTDPLEGFGVRITVATYTGIALAMPIVLYQLWAFITPGLHPREKRYALPFVFAGAALFLLGAGLAFWTIPRALEFLVDIAGDNFEQVFTGSAYLGFLVKMMVGFGIGFEFPILLVFLQLAGIISPEQLAASRRYALVGIVVLVAVITPSGDPISLTILSVPMYLFFEASIVVGEDAAEMTIAERRRRFEDGLGFPLDPFQAQALDAVDEGLSVLVAAPTGSGKTVVGEYAVAVGLDEGARVFYTTPIKALSNQKYNDLVARHGRDRVGLLTGDNAINGTAPVVVMTTEVLRNMIYARSPALDRLRWVVLDEVHYLQDEYRGPVWEEVIIHAPADVRLIALSATVSNAPELAEWITSVRGPTEVIVETTRPVDLVNHYLVGDRQSDRLHLIETLPGGRANPEGHRFDVEIGRGQRGGRERRRWYTPRRVEVIELLAERNLLPAITFIFSRAACDDAVKACLDSGMRLTTKPERERIAEIVDEHLAGMPDADLALLGYDRWRAGLDVGVAAHHAGMVPPFKEAVEQIFVEGLVKAVFATETLALGINMPARTVVIEKLSKFGGERHAVLTPGQYTQLTGRAGRRGIDSIGHAVVLWSPFTTFDDVASLASSRSFELDSAFRPTYNMAANLVRRYDADEAVKLLEDSFAQFRSDRLVVRLGTRLEQRRRRRADAEAATRCERGDIAEYRALQREKATNATPDEVTHAIAALVPGDVIAVERGVASGPAVVISVAQRRGGAVKVRVLGGPRHLVSLAAEDFSDRPQTLGRVELPSPYAPNNDRFLGEVRRRLRAAQIRPPSHRQQARRARRSGRVGHPVEACPDLDAHLRALRQVERLDREIAELERQRSLRSSGLAGDFERLLDLLEERGHLAGWTLTSSGEVLARTYHECDLVVAEALSGGLLDGLDPPTLAGVVSAFTYEHRSAQPPPEPWYPPGPTAERITAIERSARDLNAAEARSRLPLTRPLDGGFAALAHSWASGDGLDDVLSEQLLSGGDFVRNVKQLIDLLHQIASVAPERDTAGAAHRAADALRRGVVVASSAVGTGTDDDEPLDDDPPDDDPPRDEVGEGRR